jgi:hypothetical protein
MYRLFESVTARLSFSHMTNYIRDKWIVVTSCSIIISGLFVAVLVRFYILVDRL